MELNSKQSDYKMERGLEETAQSVYVLEDSFISDMST